MIHHVVTQGTTEWLMLRLGRPTASEFSRIITPAGKPSSQASDYCNELLGELILGRPLDADSFPWMERGKLLEDEARKFYEMDRGVDLEPAGFCTTDDGLVGASPDAFCGADGLVEVKCPSPGVHVGYLLDAARGADDKYRAQLQGQLYVTGRDWVDIISYHPEMPAAIVHVGRDEKFLEALAVELDKFLKVFDDRRTIIESRGWIKAIGHPIEQYDWLGVSQDDVTAMLAAAKEMTF